jgi:hypothetical protein
MGTTGQPHAHRHLTGRTHHTQIGRALKPPPWRMTTSPGQNSPPHPVLLMVPGHKIIPSNFNAVRVSLVETGLVGARSGVC